MSHNQLPLIERPLQPEVPRMPEHDVAFAPSRPLHELKEVAPPIPETFSWEEVPFPFSNDAIAPYLQRLSARSQTQKYRKAQNRVAIVVGDSHLASGAALQFMPEETIVMVDSSLAMCSFLEASISTLKGSENNQEWLRDLAESTGRHRVDLATSGRLHGQMLHWSAALCNPMDPKEQPRDSKGKPNGMQYYPYNPKVFARNRQHAQEKAIIPWHGDIFDMQPLGDALREASANVTFINLTNAIDYTYTLEKDAHGEADPAATLAALEASLATLPTTDNLPILTTSLSVEPSTTFDLFGETLATGPFFGVESLIKAGYQGEHALGRLTLRSFFPPTST